MSTAAHEISENLVPDRVPEGLGMKIESLIMVLILAFGLVTPFVGALVSALS